LGLWAIRLPHSYFRREEWKFGQREDWRYTKMEKDFPKYWWILSFFAVGLAQQPLLCGVTWPVWYANSVATNDAGRCHNCELGAADYIATVLAVCGICFAYFADTQLSVYMRENEKRVARGEAKKQLLDTGVWRYSRHPNYFGEQLFWWSIALFAVNVGAWWALAGTLINSIVLAIVTVMTERRMLRNWEPERVGRYLEYREKTSVLLPCPVRRRPVGNNSGGSGGVNQGVGGRGGDVSGGSFNHGVPGVVVGVPVHELKNDDETVTIPRDEHEQLQALKKSKNEVAA
jgi:steroid 5-alpha reductase family enzyme